MSTTLSPILKYKEVKTPDGAGGFSVGLANGVTIYGKLTQDDTTTTLTVREGTDIDVRDVILSRGAQYRVTKILGSSREALKMVEIERVQKPIVPLEEASS